MKLSIPAALILPLLIPMTIAAAVMGLGAGPRVPRVMEDFKASDADTREDALKWFADLRRTTMWRDILPYLEDEDEHVREKAVRVLEKMKNPETIPYLAENIERASAAGEWDAVEDSIKAMSNMTYPHSIPYFESYRDNPDFPMPIRLMAGERWEGTRRGLNAEVCFYTVGDPIFNGLGHVIESQAILFPEGKAMTHSSETTTGATPAP